MRRSRLSGMSLARARRDRILGLARSGISHRAAFSIRASELGVPNARRGRSEHAPIITKGTRGRVVGHVAWPEVAGGVGNVAARRVAVGGYDSA